MKIIALQSGSHGNCFYVEADGVRLLVDAGISGRQAQLRLKTHGRDIHRVDALLVSHDHRDHAGCMGVFQRKFGVPVYATRGTMQAAQRRLHLGQMQDVREVVPGSPVEFGHVVVHTLPTPHDGADGVAFVIQDARHRVGILTDLGHVFAELPPLLDTLDAVVLESNYDPTLLAEGRYPEFLQRRIRGPGGHLSNEEAGELLRAIRGKRLQWACLAHLSADNNRPELAQATHRRMWGPRFELFVATRDHASEVLEV